MKPAPFAYRAPESVEEAVAALHDVGHGAKVLAGGQSLLPLLSMRLAAPACLVDINRISSLASVAVDDGEVRVGALARHAEVERSVEVAAAQPLLREALRLVAHPTIRNRGTTVGSIAHADPAGEMTAVLTVLDGSVDVVSVRGARTLVASELFLGPLETSLAADELVTTARFPVRSGASGSAFVESARRHGDYALVGVAAVVDLDDDLRVRRARASYVSVAPTPPLLDLTDAVGGRGYDAADWAAAGRLAAGRLSPDADIHASADYRRHLVEVLTAQGLRLAAARAAGAGTDVEGGR